MICMQNIILVVLWHAVRHWSKRYTVLYAFRLLRTVYSIYACMYAYVTYTVQTPYIMYLIANDDGMRQRWYNIPHIITVMSCPLVIR